MQICVMKSAGAPVTSRTALEKLKRKQYSPFNFLKRELQEIRIQKLFYPIWFVHVLAICERRPFPPKKQSYLVYVDAVAGNYGLTDVFPYSDCVEVADEEVLEPRFASYTDILSFIKLAQRDLIRRQYVLRAPRLEVRENRLLYLPLWVGFTERGQVAGTVNALTGRLEVDFSKAIADLKRNCMN